MVVSALRNGYSFLWSCRRQRLVVLLVYCIEILGLALILRSVSYTEIDWKTYMQQVGQVVRHKVYDYSAIKGDTGRIVYPAGFVWIYALFFDWFDEGFDVYGAQCLFAFLYLVNLVYVMRIYRSIKHVPNIYLLLLPLSKRVHSIFVLRLFNDPIAMLFMHMCINYCSTGRWFVATICYR